MPNLRSAATVATFLVVSTALACSSKPRPQPRAPYGYPQAGYPQPYGYPPAPPGSPPGYGAPGYGAPGYGAPGYGAPGYGAPGYGAPGYGAPPPGYGGQPFAPTASVAPTAPAPSATAAPTTSTTPVVVLSETKQKCLGEGGTDDDCWAAVKELAASPTGSETDAVGLYEKACAKKAKLLGCGAFKSQAVTDSDRPTIGLLALCEAGRWEACEDVNTKAPPLKAWLITLKESGCKKGASALCKSYKTCKAKSDWGCKPAGSAGDVCGCVPQCSGTLSVTAGTRTWPDGSKRGVFVCEP
jgi:hypothetical protein